MRMRGALNYVLLLVLWWLCDGHLNRLIVAHSHYYVLIKNFSVLNMHANTSWLSQLAYLALPTKHQRSQEFTHFTANHKQKRYIRTACAVFTLLF